MTSLHPRASGLLRLNIQALRDREVGKTPHFSGLTYPAFIHMYYLTRCTLSQKEENSDDDGEQRVLYSHKLHMSTHSGFPELFRRVCLETRHRHSSFPELFRRVYPCTWQRHSGFPELFRRVCLEIRHRHSGFPELFRRVCLETQHRHSGFPELFQRVCLEIRQRHSSFPELFRRVYPCT